MLTKSERQRIEPKRRSELEIKQETARIAETLGKFTKMTAKNGAGDKSGIYGH